MYRERQDRYSDVLIRFPADAVEDHLRLDISDHTKKSVAFLFEEILSEAYFLQECRHKVRMFGKKDGEVVLLAAPSQNRIQFWDVHYRVCRQGSEFAQLPATGNNLWKTFLHRIRALC